MPRLPVLLALAAAVLALAACGDPAAAARPGVLGSWVLVSADDDGAPLPRPPGVPATLVVEEERMRGTAFCNGWSTGYRLDGDALTLEGIGSTEMGCDPPVMAAESALLAALAGVDRAALDGADLVLTGGGATLRFTREVPPPDREPVGTRWVLDTLVDGETASSVQGEALLLLAADGTATGSTGCRAWTGSWQRDGDVLAVDARPDATVCAPGLAAQDAHVLAVLRAAPTAAVDGDRLTLTASGGRALSYRAG